MSHAVHMIVEFYGGTDIRDAAREIVRLAGILSIAIHADFNGVLLMACPGDLTDGLVEAYHQEVKRGGQYPIARAAKPHTSEGRQ